jgi:hypothetical protein
MTNGKPPVKKLRLSKLRKLQRSIDPPPPITPAADRLLVAPAHSAQLETFCRRMTHNRGTNWVEMYQMMLQLHLKVEAAAKEGLLDD